MTRRDRLINIIDNFGGLNHRTVHHEFEHLMTKRGLAALTDEAVEELATRVVHGYRTQQRYNRANRKTG